MPNVQLEQAKARDEEEEEEEQNVPAALIEKSRPSRKKTTNPDLKGEGVASSREKPKKNQWPRSTKSHGEKGSLLMMRSAARKAKYISNSLHLKVYLNMIAFNSSNSILIRLLLNSRKENFLQVPEQQILAPKKQQALPPPELMEDVVPLTAQEGLPSTPEEQSPTLMIEGVLGDLALEVQTAEVREVEEEDGSSSTLER